jgi:hypothetical protein
MKKNLRQIKAWIIFFMIALFISGLTAMPLEAELSFLSRCFSSQTLIGAWIEKVYLAVTNMNNQYPFLAYGYDWLAFAHFVLAILFIGPLKDPVRNKWVIEFGMIACLLIIPFAFIAGHVRGIPVGWRLIDCAFGVVGLIPLSICLRKINSIEIKMDNTLNEKIFLTA